MAWKQDLAKLKQQLAPEPAVPAPKLPKPAPKHTAPVPMEDEDAVFMAAMGLKRATPPPAPAQASAPDAPGLKVVEPPAKAPETFDEALRDLKGLKPLAKGFPDLAQAKPAPAKVSAPIATPTETLMPLGVPASEPPSPKPEPAPLMAAPTLNASLALPVPPPAAGTAPLLFNLAAGMALEVDAVLDLRGHSLEDALERLKDRLGDGRILGWRVLQVTLGSDPILHEGLLALLGSGRMSAVARYARAPIPMGGNEAWLLYFAPLPSPPEPGRLEPTL